jgi:DegV family protein with EDD domain
MGQQITLFTDSACDLPENIVSSLGIKVLPFSVSAGSLGINEQEYDAPQFYSDLRTGLIAFTSAITPTYFLENMTPCLENGSDIIYIGFSSVLSATYLNACGACAELKKRYPKRSIRCIDSKSASMGQGLLTYLAAKQIEKGCSFDDTIAYIKCLIPHICHWFTVDNLNFLKRGGRINATIAVGGSSFHMKPLLHVDNEGHLVNVARVRGRDAVIKALFEKLESTAVDIQNQTVMISHGDCYGDAAKLASMIREACHPKDIIINTINLVIGAHAGPGTLALFFIGTER